MNCLSRILSGLRCLLRGSRWRPFAHRNRTRNRSDQRGQRPGNYRTEVSAIQEAKTSREIDDIAIQQECARPLESAVTLQAERRQFSELQVNGQRTEISVELGRLRTGKERERRRRDERTSNLDQGFLLIYFQLEYNLRNNYREEFHFEVESKTIED